MVGGLVGWLGGWLVCWLVGWVVGGLVGWLVGWLVVVSLFELVEKTSFVCLFSLFVSKSYVSCLFVCICLFKFVLFCSLN